MIRPATRAAGLVALALVAIPAPAPVQDPGLDPEQVALAYHKVSGTPLDTRAIAEQSNAVRRASNFDRQDALAAEIARLDAALAAAATVEFTVRVNDNIADYDHDRSEFSIVLFQPGYYIPITAFGRQYQIVFANAEGSRAIPMPKEEARDFDTRLNRVGRRVTNEIHFKVIGSGDPAGGVTGDRVIRAEILTTRLLDANTGAVVMTPPVVSVAVASAAAAATEAAFDPAAVDVAGFRIGVKSKDLEATLTRLFGKVSRATNGANPAYGLPGRIDANSLKCDAIPGRDKPRPGMVCVTALMDEHDVVRYIRVERVFPYFDGEIFRRAVTRKYGPVAGAGRGYGYGLSWGPVIPASVTKGGEVRALTATYGEEQDFIGRSGNALPVIKLTLQLIDASWAAGKSK